MDRCSIKVGYRFLKSVSTGNVVVDADKAVVEADDSCDICLEISDERKTMNERINE